MTNSNLFFFSYLSKGNYIICTTNTKSTIISPLDQRSVSDWTAKPAIGEGVPVESLTKQAAGFNFSRRNLMSVESDGMMWTLFERTGYV